MSGVLPDRMRRPLVAAAVVCAVVATAAYWWSGESWSGKVVGEFEAYDVGGSGGQRSSAGRDTTLETTARRAADASTSTRTEWSRDTSSPSPQVSPETAVRRRERGPEAEMRAAQSARSSQIPPSARSASERDVGSRSPADVGGRPDTPRHLGPRRWMAEVPEAEREVLRRDIERDVGPLYEIARADRRRAVERVDAIAASCLDRHLDGSVPKNARMVVEFVLVVDGGTAAVEEPVVRDVVALEHPSFVSCLRDGLADIQFGGGRDGRRKVEYPLFVGDRDGGAPAPSSSP